MKVLIPVDIAHPHDDLTEHVRWILPIDGEEIRLLFVKEVLPSYERLIASMGDFPDDWTHQIDKKAQAYLQPLKEKLEKAGAKVSIEIVSGPPEHLIANVAKNHNMDITVVAPGQHSNIEKFLLGSTSSSVVKLTPGTILLLRDHKGHSDLNHVVFGLDGTEVALHALRQVTKQLRLTQRKVKATVVNVVSIPPLIAMLSPAEVVVSVEKNMEMEAETIVAAGLKELKDLGVEDAEPRVVLGEASWELMRFAEQANAQLIVIGAYGHTMVEHALTGSVASRIAAHAKCSCAIVKLPKKS